MKYKYSKEKAKKILQKYNKGGGVSLPVDKTISKQEIDSFIDYVNEYYGKKGFYADQLDGGFTKAELKKAVNKYISDLDKNSTWGYGDSLDRERVRQILQPSYKLYSEGGYAEKGVKVETLDEKIDLTDDGIVRARKTQEGKNLSYGELRERHGASPEALAYAKGGGVRKVGNREYPTGRNWTNDHKHINKSEKHEVNYNRKSSFFFAEGGSLGNHGLKQGDEIIKTMSGGVQKVKTKSGDIVYVNLANGYRGAEPPLPFAKGGYTNERRHVNKSEDYEVRYAKPRPNRTGYLGKRSFDDGGFMTDPNFGDFQNGIYATGGVTKNYINRNQLNTITIKKGDQKLTYKVSDVYNGAYKLEDGGKLEKLAFYVPKRNVVKVQLKDGKDVKVANGYWIKKGAKPIHTSKYDDGGKITGSNPYQNSNLIRERYELLNDMYYNEESDVYYTDILKVGDVVYGDDIKGFARIVKEVNDPIKGDYFILQDRFNEKFAFYIVQLVRDLHSKEIFLQNVSISEKDFLYSEDLINLNSKINFLKGKIRLYEKNPNDASNYHGINYQNYISSKNDLKKLEEDFRLMLKDERRKFEDGGQLEMKFLKGGKLESKIQKKVDEVNSLIEKAIDKDGDPIMVVDKSGTWEEPMQYKPIVYKNGRLYFEYYEPYSGKTQKEVVNKSNIEFDGYPMLLDIAKMYRSALKQKGVSYADGGSLDGVKLDFDFDSEGDFDFDYPQEVEKIKLLKSKVDFDKVVGSVDYGKTIGNTNLKFYKNGTLIITLKGDYNTDTETLDTELDILGVKKQINYHPYDSMGGVDFSNLQKQLDGIDFKKILNNADWLNFIKDNKSYFDIEEQSDDFIQLTTRENGSVGDEEYGIEDIEEAKSIVKKIKEKYPKTKVSIYTVDEFVYLELEVPKEFEGGGKTTFKEKSTAIAKKFEGKKVEPKYQKEYGKTYDKAEAKEVGNKIAGSMKAKYDSKMSGGGKTKRGGSMVLAKQIRKEGESWASALKRANEQIKNK